MFNHYKGSLLELNLLMLELNLLMLALEISLYSFYDLFIVIVTDGNVTRSDVNDPFYYFCCVYWPDVIVPIYFILLFNGSWC